MKIKRNFSGYLVIGKRIIFEEKKHFKRSSSRKKII